ncbi:MAG TPA: VOC family protein, partial [Steroidobacteraceae bacterium]|nr:VOC family protein [Steroidobacteraceae bacterium]
MEGFPGRFETFCHTFYGLEDGSALSFFQFANPEVAREFKAHRQTPFVHVALSVSTAAQEEIKKRLSDAHALAFEIDHGIFRSIYAHDPNGLLVEFTCDPLTLPSSMQCRTPRHVRPCADGKPEIGLSIMTSVPANACRPQTVAGQARVRARDDATVARGQSYGQLCRAARRQKGDTDFARVLETAYFKDSGGIF